MAKVGLTNPDAVRRGAFRSEVRARVVETEWNAINFDQQQIRRAPRAHIGYIEPQLQ